MKKKQLLIIVLSLVVVASIGLLVYVLKNDILGVSNPGARYGCDADGYCVSVDKNRHIGVAKVLDKDAVKQGFGNGVTLGDAKLSGVVTLGDTQSETVSYPLKTNNGEAEFQLDARKYNSKADLEKANVFLGALKQKVEGVGEEAHYFLPSPQETGEKQFALFVVKGKVSYKFAIVQKIGQNTYTVDQAKPILLELAKKADLSKV